MNKARRIGTIARNMYLTHLLAIALACGGNLYAEDTLKIYLLAGQSNAGGYGYTYDSNGGIEENVTSIEFLLDVHPQAAAYRNILLSEGTHTVLPHLDASWMSPRNDVWAVAYNSNSGESQQIASSQVANPTGQPLDGYPNGVQPLSPGFGIDQFHAASFGPELGLGHQLGRNLDEPVLIIKSSHGGTSLAEDWRSPIAVEKRGGTQGTSFHNTVSSVKQTLDALDADLADDGILNAYDNATSYEVVGFVWLQGWNDHLEESFAFEYQDNLVDLVQSLRASDTRIANDLPTVVLESADQDSTLNAARSAAVAEFNTNDPGSAIFVETNNLIGRDWGNNRDNQPWSDSLDFHFDGKAENYLELGWRAGQAILDSGFTGSNSAPLVSSDFDLDGDVDNDDLSIWQSAYGFSSVGDANLDGVTSGNDFLIWQQEFNGTRPLASAVPEPNTAAILAIVLALQWMMRVSHSARS